MSENDNQACNALWLDPYQPAGETERERLAAAGLSLLPVRTLEDLRHALKTAKTVVVRLMDSTELLTEVRRLVEAFKKDIPVICRSTPGHMGLAVEAMREGACHVIPADDYSEQAWRAALAHVSAAEKVTPSNAEPTIATVPGPGADKPRAQAKAEQPKTFVFVDPMSQKLLALAQRVAQASVTTLITGPTGAGKEVLATVIHESSSRANGPFVSLNCGAIPENLMEDMLFGHDRGAYTGAHRDHKGIFEQAQGGTVFLDEIGELPANLQTKLLRVLQERKLTRLGGQQTIDLDFRLIAATNKDLKQAMLAREFREDLYFRISTFRLAIPALRQRPEDILPLANQMLRRHAEPGLATPTLTPESQRILLAYSWPGNVRELDNVMQRAMVLCAGYDIEPMHLLFDDLGDDQAWAALTAPDPDALQTELPLDAPAAATEAANASTVMPAAASATWHAPHVPAAMDPAQPIRLQQAVKSNEHQMILRAIEAAPTKAEAAKMLGISPRTLRYKMAQLKMAGAA
ncbi:MAG: sigma-54 dependent transcriptional regulator [Burkholderiaceae bacterium]